MSRGTTRRGMEIARHEADQIARAVVSGRRHLGSRAARIADLLAGGMRAKLEAAGAPGAVAGKRRPSSRVPRGRDTKRLLERVGKHLAAWALAVEKRAGSLPRV